MKRLCLVNYHPVANKRPTFTWPWNASLPLINKNTILENYLSVDDTCNQDIFNRLIMTVEILSELRDNLNLLLPSKTVLSYSIKHVKGSLYELNLQFGYVDKSWMRLLVFSGKIPNLRSISWICLRIMWIYSYRRFPTSFSSMISRYQLTIPSDFWLSKMPIKGVLILLFKN